MNAARKDKPAAAPKPKRVTPDEIAAAFESALNSPDVGEDKDDAVKKPPPPPAAPTRKR